MFIINIGGLIITITDRKNVLSISHINNIPTMHFHWNFQKKQSKSYMPLLTECVWDFQNNALWDIY